MPSSKSGTTMCACGCGTKMPIFDSHGRTRRFINWHWMRTITLTKGKKLTQKELREALHYNPDTGVFTWKVKRGPVKVGDITGVNPSGSGVNGGYCVVAVNGNHYRAHRLAWLYMEGYLPEHDVDHINGIRHDNRWCNLRQATQSCNMQNQKKNIRNKSGFPGVHWDECDKWWKSQIKINQKKIYIGSFYDPLEAALARYTAEVQCPLWTCNHRSELVKAIKAAWPEFNPTI